MAPKIQTEVEGKPVVVHLDVDHHDSTVTATLDVAGTEVGSTVAFLPECDVAHCEDQHSFLGCPLRPGSQWTGGLDPIQQACRDSVPDNEKNCDWFRSMDEPWRSLADALGAR